jgi:zinc/manganese transport system permease protein
VLLVFSYLIVPAALASLLAVHFHRRLLIAWGLGAALTAVGLYTSWTLDLPTGPAIVTVFGSAVALAALAAAARQLTLRKAGILACALAVLTALPLLAAPQMDQPWLDAVEDMAPVLQTAFLDSGERLTRTEAIGSIASARAELVRLQAVDQDVRWGKVEMAPEQAERLRQYLMGKSEISAGDQLVLRHLRSKARERQRLALGLPIFIAGLCGLYALMRRGSQ